MHSTSVFPCPEPDVVVVGESIIDIIHMAGGLVGFPGGSGMNVAFGLGRLGVGTAFLTALGRDEHSKSIQRHLKAAGVQLLPGSEHLRRTSTAQASLGSDGSAEYEFDLEWSLPHIAPTFLPKVLHTGSLASFVEPGASSVRSLLELFAGRCLITYDPNIRPTLLQDHAETLKTFERLVALSTVVKLSAEDAGWLYRQKSCHDVGRRVLELGAELAVITDGAAGSHLRSRTAQIDVPAAQVVVKDTVGAGDAYMSSLIAGLLEDPAGDFGYDKLSRLGTAASLAAAITVGRHGAEPPTRAELNQSLQELNESLDLAPVSRKNSDD
ncbi:carbohydrate kinase [Arthrobacter sp. fls2-241-R2A-200]|uniref:carbohydrate kinase family protein n=1 Tax=Arthrobacter sp. fls2-241-R2A-200 TaxID=3040281 RepID=UPI002550638A|nr:carbohydrate kinase [Arthrobacter sp. fls2-241-R2A-200]